ncbi:hypothetical protein D3C71_1677770 [compost metagenome]
MSSSPGPNEFGTPTVELTTEDTEASFWITLWWASALKPRPPYSFGMIMPKNLFFLMKLHSSGGRSA